VGAWGAVQQFKKLGLAIDVFSGLVAATSIGVELIKKQNGIEAINAKSNPDKMAAFVEHKLGLSP